MQHDGGMDIVSAYGRNIGKAQAMGGVCLELGP